MTRRAGSAAATRCHSLALVQARGLYLLPAGSDVDHHPGRQESTMNKRLLRHATGLLDRMLIGGLLLLVLLLLGLQVARA